MNVLVKTNNGMSRQEWLSWRAQKGIGGSDVSILFGVNRFRSIFDLWEEKTGRRELSESGSEAAYFGSILEKTVKEEFVRRTGLKVRAKNAILQSDEYPWMICNLDGVINENGEHVIFEAKTASAYKESDWEDGIPFEYVLQVNHYFAITGYEKAYVAALVGGNTFYIKTLYRDEALINKIIEVEKKFWQENVLGDKEPIADGSKATVEYLNNKYADSNGQSIELPEESLDVFREYESVCSMLDSLTYQKDSLSNQIKAFLRGYEEGYIGNYKASWREVISNRLDTKKLKAERPDVYEAYITESKHRRLKVA